VRTSVWDVRAGFRILHRSKWPAEPADWFRREPRRSTVPFISPNATVNRRVARTRRRVGELAYPPCCDAVAVSAGLAPEPTACSSRAPRCRHDPVWRCVISAVLIVADSGDSLLPWDRPRLLPSVHKTLWQWLSPTSRSSGQHSWGYSESSISNLNISCVSSVPPGKSWLVLQIRRL
jgi:hypothetical protein